MPCIRYYHSYLEAVFKNADSSLFLSLFIFSENCRRYILLVKSGFKLSQEDRLFLFLKGSVPLYRAWPELTRLGLNNHSTYKLLKVFIFCKRKKNILYKKNISKNLRHKKHSKIQSLKFELFI